MRISQILAFAVFATSATSAVSLPEANAIAVPEADVARSARSEILSPENSLEKRKGGGGKGGGGSSGGGKSSGGGSSSSGGKTSSSSNVGGATKSGSGPSRSYGGGGYYGGGAASPYAAGQRTPRGLLAGALFLPAAALLIFPGIWLYSVYPYYLNNYHFLNQTYHNATQNGLNQTLPVTCLCQEYAVCGCDNNDNPTYLNDLVGNGSYAALNKTLVNVANVNGTTTLVINGTLPNGTTAPGGTDDAGVGLRVSKYSGLWVMGMILLSALAFL